MLDDESPHPLTHTCPACGQPVEIPTSPTGAPLQCPACGEQFIIDDEPADEKFDEPSTSEDRLETQRIQRIASMRRATYRSRSHAIIAAVVSAVGAIQLGILAWRTDRGTLMVAAYLIVAIVATYGSIFFVRRALALNRAINQRE